MNFKEVISRTNDVKTCYKVGLRALRPYNSKVEVANTSELGGSVSIDDCIKRIVAQENRWDYVFGYKGEAFFVEVHPAHTSGVKTVIDKFNWLLTLLEERAPLLNSIRARDNPFYWLQTDGYFILKNSSQERALVQKGLRPVSKIRLP